MRFCLGREQSMKVWNSQLVFFKNNKTRKKKNIPGKGLRLPWVDALKLLCVHSLCLGNTEIRHNWRIVTTDMLNHQWWILVVSKIISWPIELLLTMIRTNSKGTNDCTWEKWPSNVKEPQQWWEDLKRWKIYGRYEKMEYDILTGPLKERGAEEG